MVVPDHDWIPQLDVTRLLVIPCQRPVRPRSCSAAPQLGSPLRYPSSEALGAAGVPVLSPPSPAIPRWLRKARIPLGGGIQHDPSKNSHGFDGELLNQYCYE